MTEEEEWVKSAMSDDSVVVDMLLRLHHADATTSPPHARKKVPAGVLQLEWSVRQRRSRQQVPRKKGDSTRASPTTPLSWSGATSFSGGAADGGFEESSKPSKPIDSARSKVVVTGETNTARRTRKKKTLAELKEEESMLLKERRNLKNKLATLRLSFEEQRAENESLKRMKHDVLSQQTLETVRALASQKAILNHSYQMKVLCDPSCMILPAIEAKPYPQDGSSKVHEGRSEGSSFLLPDLNLPVDCDSGLGNLYGVS